MATLTQAGITFGDGTSQSTASTGFPTGTLMLFQQTAAPTGWTKQTTHNDKALRVVSGTAGSGGSLAFSSFVAQSIGETTLSIAQMPSHTHTGTFQIYWAAGQRFAASDTWGYDYSHATNATGGGGSHTHSLNMQLQYVDLIIASKN